MAVDVRQTEVAPLVAIGQSLVVDAQQMQDRCVQVVDVHRARRPLFLGRLWPHWCPVGVGNVVTVVVRLAVGDPGFHAAAGHSHSKTSRVMIAAVVLFRQVALAVGCAAELTAPDH